MSRAVGGGRAHTPAVIVVQFKVFGSGFVHSQGVIRVVPNFAVSAVFRIYAYVVCCVRRELIYEPCAAGRQQIIPAVQYHNAAVLYDWR